MSPATSLTVVSATVPRDLTDALVDALSGHDLSASTWEDLEGTDCRVQVFLEQPTAAAGAAAALARVGRELGLDLAPEVRMLPPEDWSESWKRFFHVTRVSPRIVVRPPWEPYAAAAGECVIVLDPGMSFGTGRHGTTQACLQFLDELAQARAPRSLLDIGCGSGILAIAACQLGFAPVTGIDCDADAVRIAGENAAINGVAPRLETADLATSALRAGVVVANVLAGVLREHAARVAAAVEPVAGGALVLSGILDGQYAAVRDTYAGLGFVERRSRLIGEWRSGWFERG